MPNITISGLLTVLSNPTVDFMEKAKVTGEEMTWPFMAMIKNHSKIERALDRAYKDMSEVCHFSNSQSDLRRLSKPPKRPSLRRNGSTQSLPDGFGIASLTASQPDAVVVETKPPLPVRSATIHVDHQTEDTAKPDQASNAHVDTTESDELDPDSMTSQTPPLEMVESESDEEIEELILRAKSEPVLPTPPSGRPRSRSPGVTPIALLMTPASVPRAGGGTACHGVCTDHGLESNNEVSSILNGYTKLRGQKRMSRPIEIPFAQPRQRSLSTGYI